MRRASDRARKEDRRNDIIVFLFHEGIFHYRRGEAHTRSAMKCWEECMAIDVSSWSWDQRQMPAYGCACGHHFDQARQTSTPEEAALQVQKMRAFRITRCNAYLASYYANVTKDTDKSRAVPRQSFESAAQMLSDDDDDNDWEGYYHMAFVLMHSGDVLNALSAFSLLFPKPSGTNALSWILEFDKGPVKDLSVKLIDVVKKECTTSYLQDQINLLFKHFEGAMPSQPDTGSDMTVPEGQEETKDDAPSEAQEPTLDQDTRDAYLQIKARLDEWHPCSLRQTFWFKCSGPCGKQWGFEEAMHVCKFCFDTGFCGECLARLKTGDSMLQAIETRCSKDHEWLHVPRWDREGYLNSLKKRVLVGGGIDEQGRRVGGEVVEVDEWLGGLKKEWDCAS